MGRWFKSIGPGLLVTAAFVGPGTVTTASVAGADFGFSLLWAVIFSIFATIVLQEMASRLGVVSRQGLGEALRTTFRNPVLQALAIFLVIGAIAFGNAAFEASNITGAAVGLEVLTGVSPPIWAIVVGSAAFMLLASGIYKLVERVLIALVIIMSVVFLLTAIVTRPNFTEVLAGMFVPRLPAEALVTTIALIGTTVVPYNLFLHAASVQEKWSRTVNTQQALAESRLDTIFSVLLGGLITLAIVATAAATFFEQGEGIENPGMMAEQLEPLLGPAAKYFFATGLLAAGLTSAITAPLAAAYATSGALGWECNLRSTRFKLIWIIIVTVGTILSFFGTSPVTAIVFAQAANGILLPLIATFLLVVMNRADLLRGYRNGWIANFLGLFVVLVTFGLGAFQFLKVIGIISV